MTLSWTISVGGRVYGPDSLDQMQGFHAENRLADHSLVAREGQEQFQPAIEDPDLAQLFRPNPRRPPATRAASFWRAARTGDRKRAVALRDHRGPEIEFDHRIGRRNFQTRHRPSLHAPKPGFCPANPPSMSCAPRWSASWASSTRCSSWTRRMTRRHEFNFGPESDSASAGCGAARPTMFPAAEKRAIRRS